MWSYIIGKPVYTHMSSFRNTLAAPLVLYSISWALPHLGFLANPSVAVYAYKPQFLTTAHHRHEAKFIYPAPYRWDLFLIFHTNHVVVSTQSSLTASPLLLFNTVSGFALLSEYSPKSDRGPPRPYMTWPLPLP